jgi:hypothetical protein
METQAETNRLDIIMEDTMQFDEKGNFCISEVEIIQVFSYAFKRIVTEDKHLFESGVQERALQFRLALYLRKQLKFAECRGLFIDVEYNRDGKNNKKRPSPNCEKSWIAPDIILHERGSADYEGDEKFKNDIIYCEIKKNSKSGNQDATKIKEQMINRKYQFGIDLFSLKPENVLLDLYVLNDNKPVKTACYKYIHEKQMLEKYQIENVGNDR